MPTGTITAREIVIWASRRDAQSLLPVLIRRLVFSTGSELVKVGFPAFESIALPGWDGVVIAGENDTYVPKGNSAWELGTGDDPATKAEGDYRKRTSDPRGIEAAKSTFVFVTARRWPRKDDWARERTAEGLWQEVRVYDADTLEQWLENAPATLFWFAEQLGIQPEHAWDVGVHWRDWAELTAPPMSAALVLAGRDGERNAVEAWLVSSRPVLTLAAQSSVEAVVFFEAVVESLAADARDRVQSRTVVVGSDAAWQRLVRSHDPLVLLPVVSGVEIGAAIRRGHRVVVATNRATLVDPVETVNIPGVGKPAATEALVAMGIPEDRARDLAEVGHNNLLALRRRMARSLGALKPDWAETNDAGHLLSLLLLGAWNGTYDDDRSGAAALAGSSYDQLEALLLRLATAGDPPGRKVGDLWRAVSREELWENLSGLLSDGHVQRFVEFATTALSVPRDRSASGLAGLLARSRLPPQGWSDDARLGLAESLAFCATFGQSVPVTSTRSIADAAQVAVRRVLENASGKVDVWAALCPMLSDIAEAGPDLLLSAIEADLRSGAPVLPLLFEDGTDDLVASSPHTGLLWALELLAWDQRYVSRVALQLAVLVRLDPGGRLSNRPAKSLTDIFRLWKPATTASVEERLVAVDLVRTREPGISWDLMVSLLPTGHDTAMSKARPKFRRWAGDPGRSVTWGEFHRGLDGVVSRMLADVGPIGPRWVPSLKSLGHLPRHLAENVVSTLEVLSVERVADQERATVCDCLRDLVYRHRLVDDPNHRMPDEMLTRLDTLIARLAPVSSGHRLAWLFTWLPEIPDLPTDDYSARQQAIQEAQDNAVREIVSTNGIEGLLETARLVDQPHMVGFAAGRIGPVSDERTWLAVHLISDRSAIVTLARGYVAGRFAVNGWEWVHPLVESVRATWPAEALANLIASLPYRGSTWDAAEQLGPRVEALYWEQLRPLGIPDPEEVERAARKLLQHDRPFVALEVLGLYARGSKEAVVSPLLAFEALDAAATRGLRTGEAMMGSFDHSVGELLDLIVESGSIPDEQVAAAEWAWLPLFRFGRRKPTSLHRELARKPSFFVDLVCLVYRAKGEEPRELSEAESARATVAHDLLEHWREPPGIMVIPDMEQMPLREWVAEARRGLAEKGRSEIGEICIGHLLSGAGLGADGFWPHDAVRDLMEEIGSEDLEQGIVTGKFNSRGIVWRGTGGDDERKLANFFTEQEQGIGGRWPRTSAMLRAMAESYRRDARRDELNEEELG